MTIKTLYIGCMVAACCVTAPAQVQTRVPAEPLRIEQNYLGREGDSLRLRFTADYSGLAVAPQEQLVLQPLLIRRTDTVKWPPVLLTGYKRMKANHRKEALGYPDERTQPYRQTIRAERNRNNKIQYDAAIPFRPWMNGAQAELAAELSGCADCRRELSPVPLGTVTDRTPEYAPQVMFIVPEVEPVKNRTEKGEAFLTFPQGQAVILTGLGDNAGELRKLDTLVGEVVTDPNCDCQGIELIGYASPEGNYAYNTRLSEARARSLKTYLEKKHTGARCPFSSEGRSEDWEGVRRWVEQSTLPYRQEVIGIIGEVENPDARDARIRQLDNGATYRILLEQAYPPLRRVDCVLHYTVVPFTPEEGKKVLRTAPQQLSLNELFLIAETYPAGSREFNEVFETAARYYPDNVAANNNAAAAALLEGDPQKARRYLDRTGEAAAAQNNRGVWLLMEGHIPEAKACFEKAKAYGSKEAENNLQQMK
ncbi:MAG: DUF3868 domain-containing protein [Parabacteroides sp.]|nr:DUF3868 domain-containing protein [Parabacteroides sp.]